jgi:site-specific DNA-methyltransferase (adenine-specific)
LKEAYRLLTPNGSLYFHIDYREVHYCKILLDRIFGRDSFINEIIWAYDYGARTRKRWPPKHDNILWYAKDPQDYVFNYEEIERIPYMAPGLVGKEKPNAASCLRYLVAHHCGHQQPRKTGYPTQKPLAILRRIIQASSKPGDTVLDFFAGSGTTGAACRELGRAFILVDNNPQAMEVMAERFKGFTDIEWVGYDPA